MSPLRYFGCLDFRTQEYRTQPISGLKNTVYLGEGIMIMNIDSDLKNTERVISKHSIP